MSSICANRGRASYTNGSFCATLRNQENMDISHKIFSDMANKSDPMDLKQIITLHKNVVSNRQMGELLDISRNTVKSYIKQIRGSDYSLDELLAWSDRNRHPDKCQSRLLF